MLKQLLIKPGMGFGTVFDMGIYQNQLIVTIGAFKSCPSLNLMLGELVLCYKNCWIRPATESSQTQKSSRDETDTQRHLEPGTPNISPRSFS